MLVEINKDTWVERDEVVGVVVPVETPTVVKVVTRTLTLSMRWPTIDEASAHAALTVSRLCVAVPAVPAVPAVSTTLTERVAPDAPPWTKFDAAIVFQGRVLRFDYDIPNVLPKDTLEWVARKTRFLDGRKDITMRELMVLVRDSEDEPELNGLRWERTARTIAVALAVPGSDKAVDDGWQPIETAPKTGEEIDLWAVTGYRMPNSRWVSDIRTHGGRKTGWRVQDGGIYETGFTHWRRAPDGPAKPSRKDT